MSHWLQDFLGTLWLMRLPSPPPTSSYVFSVRFSGRLLELWLLVIMGTTLGFLGAVSGAVTAGDLGTMRCPDGELEELGVKLNPERGRVGKRPVLVLVLLSGPWKALLELRFSMEWYKGLFTEGGRGNRFPFHRYISKSHTKLAVVLHGSSCKYI